MTFHIYQSVWYQGHKCVFLGYVGKTGKIASIGCNRDGGAWSVRNVRVSSLNSASVQP